jgi:hypothetical protein
LIHTEGVVYLKGNTIDNWIDDEESAPRKLQFFNISKRDPRNASFWVSKKEKRKEEQDLVSQMTREKGSYHEN